MQKISDASEGEMTVFDGTVLLLTTASQTGDSDRNVVVLPLKDLTKHRQEKVLFGFRHGMLSSLDKFF